MTISRPVQDHKDWEKEWAQSWAPDETGWVESTLVDAGHQTGYEIEWESFHWDGFKKYPSKEKSLSFQFLHRFCAPTTLFFLLVGIAGVFPFAARAKGTDPAPPVNNVVSVVPVQPVDNVGGVAPVDPVNIDLGALERAVRGLIPNGYNPNPTPPPVGPVAPIDWSPNYEEKWKGALTQENLESQREEAKLLRDQGKKLQYELFQLDSNHNLLTYQTRDTLACFHVKRAIRANKRRYLDLQPTPIQFRDDGYLVRDLVDPVGYQVNGEILEEYRAWRTCASTLSTAIQELELHRPLR